MNVQTIKRKLAAILSADVEGYSRLMGNDEVSTIQTLAAYKKAILGLAYRGIGRYEDALEAYQKALPQYPNTIVVQLGLAACYAALGRQPEAHSAVAEVLKLNPDFSLDFYPMTIPFKNQSDLERHLNDLRKAGLK